MAVPKDADEVRDALPGTVLMDKWRIVRPIGKGGMSTVYEAIHRNGRRVALKVLHPTLAANERARTRFLRESTLANRVNHPGVVAVIDEDVTPDGTVFLVMELLVGETLQQRWERQTTLPLADVLSIAEQILDPLAVLHGTGIVHRDIKPSNVFVTEAGVKLLDFGIARLREVGTEESVLTRSGAMLGTPSFMAPEQARGHWDDVDARTDVWAVGAILFSLLAGRFVHEGATPNELLIAAATQRAVPLAKLVPSIPRAVATLVDRAIAFERSDRWPDAATMLDRVRAIRGDARDEVRDAPARPTDDAPAWPTIVSGETTRGSQDADRVPIDRSIRRPSRRWFAISVAVAVLLAAGAAWRRTPRAVDVTAGEMHTSAVIPTPATAAEPPPPLEMTDPSPPAEGRERIASAPRASISAGPPLARTARPGAARKPSSDPAPVAPQAALREAGADATRRTFSGVVIDDDTLDQHK